MNLPSFDAHRLRADRSAAFRREILPYLRYVMASGALGFSLFAILGLYAYSEWVKRLPAGPAALWVAVAACAPVIALSPVRTYFRPADVAFLIALEARLDGYIRSCLRSALIVQLVWLGAIWLLIWPMLRVKAGFAHSYDGAIIFGQLVMLKALHLSFGWRIKQLRESKHRTAMEPLRIAMALASAYAAIAAPLPWSLVWTGAAGVVFALALQSLPAYRIHWEHLIRLEQSHRGHYYSFIGAFIDVPRHPSSVTNNRLAPLLAKPFAGWRGNPFRFLYALTWARSDIFGISVRLTALGAVLLAIAGGDWVKAAIFAMFVYLIGVQLSGLNMYHLYSDWLFVYPLTERQRALAASGVIRTVHAGAALLLAIPFAATADDIVRAGAAIAAVGVLYAIGYTIRTALIRKAPGSKPVR